LNGEEEVRVPDLGGEEDVDVVEILVEVGEEVAVDDGLITLESDKASMDIPSPLEGTVASIKLKTGDKVSAGDLVLTLEDVPTSLESPSETEEEVPADLADSARAAEFPETATDSRDQSTEASPDASTEAADASSADPYNDVQARDAPQIEPAEFEGGDHHAEVLVLGSGVGGYTAAFRAADLGKKVILVERYPKLGGVCLNVGCIPSKALLHLSKVIAEAEEAAQHGVTFGQPKIDLEKLRSFKNGVVDRLTKGLGGMTEKRGVTVVEGTGHFVSPRMLEVETAEGTTTISFDQAIIAAGSRPAELPGIPHDDPKVIDSTGALKLAGIPKRLLLIGGGIVGLEMATVYGSLESQITIVELLDGLIPGCDRDLVKPLERRLKRRFKAEIYTGTKATSFKVSDSAIKVSFEGKRAPESAAFDRILVAVGRRPNTDQIGIEAAEVELSKEGFIRVDRQQRTNQPHIFAVGDIVGNPMLAHKGSHQGKVAAEVAAGEKSSFDARVIPSVAYTDPEIAWVGLTETEAKEKSIDYSTGSFPWMASGRSLGMGRTDGLTKLLFDPTTQRLLGAGIVGPSAGDLIAECALAIEMGAEAADLALTIHPHPTLSETVSMAAEAFEGTITDLYLPKKR
jgi:dihydrolipoamide dehydrogenase